MMMPSLIFTQPQKAYPKKLLGMMPRVFGTLISIMKLFARIATTKRRSFSTVDV